MNQLKSLAQDQTAAVVNNNNMLFTNAIKELYDKLCNSNQWGIVDEVEVRNTHGRYVYNKIRRFTNCWERNKLLEITINLKPGVEYCPKWYRRMCINDYYASGDERYLGFYNYNACVLYEFVTDVPEYYNYDYEVADSITITYGDRELTITGEHIKSSYDILRIMNKELQLTF